jgi:serine/threonine protein kinase
MMVENTVLNNRYRLEKKIGQGGFARVYLATDTLLKRQVAVKILRPDITDNADFLYRFEQEAQQIAALNHPNILPVFDYGFSGDMVYLIMPYVSGGTLNQKIKDGRLSLAQTGRYLQQMADALDYAHKRNIVHRDIKPHNMLVQSDNDYLLLADFGIAKVVSATGTQSTTGAVGTPAYMSPEQLRGLISPANDIYALGCVLFQMLTGEAPYSGTTEQVITSHLVEPVPSVVARSKGLVPAAMQPVLERALAKQVEVRFRTAGEMAKAFHVILNEEITGEGTRTHFTPPTQVIAPTPPYIPPPQTGLPVAPPTQVAPWVWSPPPNPQPMIPGNYRTPVPPDKKPVAAQKPGNPLVAVLVTVFILALFSAGGTVAFFALSRPAPPVTTVANIPTNTISGATTPVPNVIPANTPRPTSPSAPTSTPRPTNTATPPQTTIVRGKIGETSTLLGHSVTVNQIEKVKTLDRATDASGMAYILVELTFEAGVDLNLTSQLLVNEPTLKDSQNYLYPFISQPFITVNKTWLITLGSSLKKGDKVKGWLAFQVPEGLQGWLFEFRVKPDFSGSVSKAQVPLDDVAPEQYSPPQTVGVEGKVGETVATNGYFLTVNKQEKSPEIQTGRTLFPNVKAAAGKQFVTLEVTFESTNNEIWAVNYGNAVLKDGEGIRYNPALRKYPAILTTDVENSTRAKGWLTYEIPLEAKNLVLEYSDTRQVKTPLKLKLGS